MKIVKGVFALEPIVTIIRSPAKLLEFSSIRGAAAKKISCLYLFFKVDQNLYNSSKNQEIVNTYITPDLDLQDFIALTTLQSFQGVIVNH